MLKKARELTLSYTKRNEHSNAAFWAEKATKLSNGNIEDVYLYAQSLYANHEFVRALHVLESSPQLSTCSGLRYLAAKCLAACKSWEEVIAMLKQENDENDFNDTNQEMHPPDIVLDNLGDVTTATLVLIGRAYEAMGNIQEAISSYKQAIVEDVYCMEALECLHNCYSLTAGEEAVLMNAIPVQQEGGENEIMLRYLYQSKLRHGKKSIIATSVPSTLSANIDTLCNKAQTLFHQMNIKACLALTSEILKQDPYHFSTILTYIPCCVVSNNTKDLYTLGHSLVKHFPTSAISWYAVSAYYYAINNHAQARRYLTKSIGIDPHFAHSHLLFGLSFTSEGEHDQAIAAFSHAARYLIGSHVPYMYLAKEYFMTNSLSMSTSFFKNALALAPSDPVLLQEVGVVLLSSGHYEKAEKYFKNSIYVLSGVDSHTTLSTWEPVYNNLGHTQRKQGKFSEAIESHTKALQLKPNEPTTLTAIAFVHLLLFEFPQVIEYCNRSLRVKRDDLVTIELLQIATKEMASQPFELIDSSAENVLDQQVYDTSIVEDTGTTNVSLSSSESAMQTD